MPTSTILIVCDVIATAMIAGFLTMYCLTIGGYFTFMARTGRIGELQGSYPLFRRRTRLKRVYALAMLLQFLVALAALAAGWGSGPLGLVPAACSLPLLLVVHALTGFTGPEEKLVSGQDLTDGARPLPAPEPAPARDLRLRVRGVGPRRAGGGARLRPVGAGDGSWGPWTTAGAPRGPGGRARRRRVRAAPAAPGSRRRGCGRP